MKKPSFQFIRTVGLLLVIACVPTVANADVTDSHSVESIVNALKMPIPELMVKQSREADDSLMRGGQDGRGNKLYLITDERSTRVNQLTTKLLKAMGENESDWVVRVFDTDPKVQNAFVMGGKYIYVFTGLIEDAGEDELAFILSHEIGHSVLKHYLRKKEDTVNSTMTGLAVIVAALSSKNRELAKAFGKTIGASYSRVDEEEADAFGVATAKRAGFNPIHGADFFVRMERKQDQTKAEEKQKFDQLIENARVDMNNAQNNCQQWKQKYNSAVWRSPQLVNNVNVACQDANGKVQHYNQLVSQRNLLNLQERSQSSSSTHPANQNRVAAISALVDFLDGRRDIDSLSKFEQSYRVMQALQQTNNMVVQPPTSTVVAKVAEPATTTVVDVESVSLQKQLEQLAAVRKQGLITEKEYKKKRQQLIDRF